MPNTKDWDDRCGQCKNCKYMEKIRKLVLRNCNPPFTHADQDVVDLWNRELEGHPCQGPPDRYKVSVVVTLISTNEHNQECFTHMGKAHTEFDSLEEVASKIKEWTGQPLLSVAGMAAMQGVKR